jgi:hypothetical protein
MNGIANSGALAILSAFEQRRNGPCAADIECGCMKKPVDENKKLVVSVCCLTLCPRVGCCKKLEDLEDEKCCGLDLPAVACSKASGIMSTRMLDGPPVAATMARCEPAADERLDMTI